MNIDFKDKRTIALLVTTGTLLVLTSAILAFIFLVPEKKIEIPDFINKNKTDVETWMIDNELTEERITFAYEYNETLEKESVVSQSILPGEKLKKDDILTVTLSDGYDPTLIVTLPDFTSMKYDEINQWFIDNKFSDVTYEYIPDEKIEKDTFIKSNLTTNEAHRNDVIVISISVGLESVGVEITMPDFADYTKANIQAWGKTNNMTITFKNESSDKIAANKVISQSPKAGETTTTGSKVTVSISTGKGVTAIKFDGKTKKDVDAWAKENSMKINYVDVYDSKVASGLVVSNKPNSGTITTNSTITVNISIGKPSIDNYTNKSVASFQTYVDGLNKKSANIKVSVSEVQSTTTPGTILKQTINGAVVSGATTVDPGTTVYLEVSKLKTITVESKAGSTEASFKTYINGLGLVVGSKTERYSTTVSKGNIISNDTGTKTTGATINYVLSKGAYAPSATDFDGKTEAAAASMVTTANNEGANNWSFTAYQYVYNDSVAYGKTYGCSIKGTAVACYVSLGKAVTVPDYVTANRKPCSTSSCTVDGLKVTLRAVDSDKDENTVLSQSIAAGTKVAENSEIIITFSNGKNKPACPVGATGTYPNCSCPANYEYNTTSNTCTLIVVTTGKLPNFNLANYDGQSYNQITTALTKLYNDAGFNNLNFIQLTGEIDNPDNENGIDSITPAPNGATIELSTTITIKIKVAK